MSRIRSLALSVAGGYLCYLGSRPNGWWLAIVGTGFLARVLTQESRRHRFFGLLMFSAGMYVPLLKWMQLLGVDAWVLISVLSILPWLLLAALPALEGNIKSIFAYACGVVLIEYVHSVVPLGGFPWGLLAYTQLDGPLMWWARIGSQYAVSLVIVLVGFLFFFAVRDRSFKPLLVSVLVCVLGNAIPTAQAHAGSQLQVAAIQGNVPREGLDVVTQATRVTENHIAQTQVLTQSIKSGLVTQPQLVVWPENGVDGDPIADTELHDRMQTVINDLGAPILVGALIWDIGAPGPSNSGLLWLPKGSELGSGVVARYDKNHLVPFGEYIPSRELMTRFIGRLDQIPVDYYPGHRPGIFDLGSVRIGDIICFEISYDDHVRAALATGASLLTVQSNNATYALTEQPGQQLAVTRFRAVEHQRSVVVATTTGFSAVILPSGKLLDVSKEMTAAIVSGQVPLITSRQLSDYLGDWVVIMFLGYLMWFLSAKRRTRKLTV